MDTPLYKILIVGDTQTGKSSFIRKSKGKMFNSEYTPTKKVNFELLKFSQKDFLYTFLLCDVSGNEISNYYLNKYLIEGVIICIDSSQLSTINIALKWYTLIKDNKSKEYEKYNIPPIYLIVTKCDLLKDDNFDKMRHQIENLFKDNKIFYISNNDYKEVFSQMIWLPLIYDINNWKNRNELLKTITSVEESNKQEEFSNKLKCDNYLQDNNLQINNLQDNNLQDNNLQNKDTLNYEDLSFPRKLNYQRYIMSSKVSILLNNTQELVQLDRDNLDEREFNMVAQYYKNNNYNVEIDINRKYITLKRNK